MPSNSEAIFDSLLFDGIDSDLHAFAAYLPFPVDEWKCVVCHGTSRYPASLKSCGHFGCLGSLMQVVETKRDSLHIDVHEDDEVRCPCPLCTVEFAEEDISPLSEWPLVLRKAWEALRVNCRGFKEYDRKETDFTPCPFKGPIRELMEHEKTCCDNRIIRCPVPGCKHSGPAFKMSDHYYKCEHLMFHCSQCGMVLKFVENEHHNCVDALQKSLKYLEKQCKKGKFEAAKGLFPGKPGTMCNEFEPVDEDEVVEPAEPTPPAASNHPFDIHPSQPRGGDWPAPAEHPRVELPAELVQPSASSVQVAAQIANLFTGEN